MELNIVQISPEQFSDLITKTINKAVKQALDDNREKERLLTLKDTSQYLNLSIQTLYSYTSRKTIPYIKKGKKLYSGKKTLMNGLGKAIHKSINDHFTKNFKIMGSAVIGKTSNPEHQCDDNRKAEYSAFLFILNAS